MRHPLGRSGVWTRWAASTALFVTALSLPTFVLTDDSPAVLRADDGCGVGFYFDAGTDQCEPWAQPPPPPAVEPVLVPVPNFNVCLNAGGRRGRISGSVCV